MNELSSGPPNTEVPTPSLPAGWLARCWNAVRRHPFRALCAAVALLVVYELLTIPWFDIPSLRTKNPPETALMRQRQHEAEATNKRLNVVHRWIPLKKLPRTLLDAVVVAEDGTFYSHGGVDWFEIRQSIEKNIRQRKFARGGSTITQQLAKNLYLSTSKDPVRKLKELVITVLLEHYLDKERILELYVNEIEWGRGIFGVESAAQTYFSESASSLSPDQCYRLAAVIPSPLRHRPDTDSRYVLRRKEIVERRLVARSHGVTDFTDEDTSATGQDAVSGQEQGIDSTGNEGE